MAMADYSRQRRVGMDLGDKKEELHAAITASAMLERRIFELQRADAPIDDIAAAIEQRVQFEKTAARLNVEIATETQARNLSFFLDQMQAMMRSELEASGLVKTLNEVAARQKKSDHERKAFEASSAADRADLRKRIAAIEQHLGIEAHGDATG